MAKDPFSLIVKLEEMAKDKQLKVLREPTALKEITRLINRQKRIIKVLAGDKQEKEITNLNSLLEEQGELLNKESEIIYLKEKLGKIEKGEKEKDWQDFEDFLDNIDRVAEELENVYSDGESAEEIRRLKDKRAPQLWKEKINELIERINKEIRERWDSDYPEAIKKLIIEEESLSLMIQKEYDKLRYTHRRILFSLEEQKTIVMLLSYLAEKDEKIKSLIMKEISFTNRSPRLEADIKAYNRGEVTKEEFTARIILLAEKSDEELARAFNELKELSPEEAGLISKRFRTIDGRHGLEGRLSQRIKASLQGA